MGGTIEAARRKFAAYQAKKAAAEPISLGNVQFSVNTVRQVQDLPAERTQKTGSNGGRLTYSFTPTGVGTVAKVKCACREMYGRENGIVT